MTKRLTVVPKGFPNALFFRRMDMVKNETWNHMGHLVGNSAMHAFLRVLVRVTCGPGLLCTGDAGVRRRGTESAPPPRPGQENHVWVLLDVREVPHEDWTRDRPVLDRGRPRRPR